MYYIYILQCGDESLYTGITTDVKKRLSQHKAGLGAKYTRGRGPLTLVYVGTAENRSEASREEARIKKLKKCEKVGLIEKCSKEMIENVLAKRGKEKEEKEVKEVEEVEEKKNKQKKTDTNKTP